MGSFASCDDSASGSNGFRSCFYSLDCEEFCVKLEQSSPTSTKNVNEVFLEDLDGSISEEEDFNDSIVKELGISLCDTLHVHEHPRSLGVGNPALFQENICKQMEIDPLSFDTDVPKSLSKCASMQCSELVQSYLVNSDADGLLRTTVINENNSKVQNLAFVQPTHTTTELVPALKGSRALYGKHLNTQLSLKWAPDVYDPPATSSSHTVKGPRRRRDHHPHHHAKSKKDHHSHKYSKGKSSGRSSTVTDRKLAAYRRSSLTDPRVLRLQSLGCSRQVLNPCGQSKIEFLDLAIRSDDDAIMFGRGCSVESPAPVQLPAAKAS